MPEDIPRKLFYKLGEVCQLTDTQPYVLRFWESEFSRLAPSKSRTGQRLYRRKDIDLVMEIKKLLYEEGHTISSVRQKLGMPEGQGALEGLFEPPGLRAAPATGAALRTVSSMLGEILQILDDTDRRLERKPERRLAGTRGTSPS